MADRCLARMFLTAVVVLALGLVPAGAAVASTERASNGAFHIDTSDPFCDHLCFHGTAVGTLTTTPSGRAVLTYHEQRTLTFIGFACVGTGDEMINDVQVLAAEETGVYHYTNRSTLTYVCQEAPAPVTCTTMRVYTFANGDVRVERVTSECTTQGSPAGST